MRKTRLRCWRQTKLAAAESELAEFVEEHTGDDGLLADATNDSGNITASSVKARLKATHTRGDDRTATRRKITTRHLRCPCAHSYRCSRTKISRADKERSKEAQLALDGQVLAHYTTLTEEEIKAIVVVKDKWVASVQCNN